MTRWFTKARVLAQTERDFVLRVVVLGVGVVATLVLSLVVAPGSLVQVALVLGTVAIAIAGATTIVRRTQRALRHSERINRAGLAFASEARPGILRAGLRAATDIVGERGAEASIVTRNVHGELVVEATSVERTLPYLPAVDLEAMLGAEWNEVLVSPVQRPRTELARALAMRNAEGTMLLVPMRADDGLTGLLAVGSGRQLASDEIEAVRSLAALLGSALTREQLHDKLTYVRAEAHFQSLVRDGSDLILVIREDLSITYQSPSVARILGYADDALLSRSVTSLATPEQVPALTQVLRRACELEDDLPALRRDSEWLDAQGRPRRVRVSITNRLEEPMVRGLVLNVTDETERMEAHEALQRSQATLRQVAKLDAVGRLAGGIAHDFNNILGAIMMMAGSLREELHDLQASDETVGEIENAAARGARLTRQLLAFSRADEPSPELADVGEIVETMHKMLRRLIDERVELHTRPAIALPSVLVDRGILEQALMNLVVNARDALHGGRGTIVLETESRRLARPHPSASGREIPAGNYVVLSVVDDGVGMTPEVLERVLEPFFTTKSIDKGTGLGLSMVYGIVEQSGGHLEILSTPGEGTTVSIYLPARREVSGPLRQAYVPKAPRGEGRLLVVEDDTVLRQTTIRALRGLGYEVMGAADGTTAMQLFDEAEQPFDLVVTDVIMPGCSGPELVGRLRRQRAELPVLYASGYSDGMLVSLGPHEALLRKPFRPEELAVRVHAMLAAGEKDRRAG